MSDLAHPEFTIQPPNRVFALITADLWSGKLIDTFYPDGTVSTYMILPVNPCDDRFVVVKELHVPTGEYSEPLELRLADMGLEPYVHLGDDVPRWRHETFTTLSRHASSTAPVAILGG